MLNLRFHKTLYQASSKAQLTTWLVPGLFILCLMAVESYLVYEIYATRFPGTADFFSRWYGARELIFNGRNPYAADVEAEIQLAMFGARRPPDQDQVNFAYPLYTIYLFWPLTLVSYAWAQAIWMVVLQFILLGTTILLFNLTRWKPPVWLFAATLVWALFFYPAARAIMLGQFSIIVFSGLVIALWSLANGKDKLAGAILPLTTIKPQMVFLVIPFMLWWAWRQKRWAFINAFGLSAAALLLTSLLWLPGWPFHFFNVMLAYTGYVNHGSPLENMTGKFLPGLDHLLNPMIVIALIALLLWQWRLALTAQPGIFLWVVNLTLLITNLIAFRSATTNHVVLYLTIFILFKRLAPAHWKIVAGQVFGLIGLWVLFLTTIDKSRSSNFEAIFMHGFLPSLLIIIYLLDWRRLKMVTPEIKV